MVNVGCQKPTQSPRTPCTKSSSIHVIGQGSGGAQRNGRCMIFPSWSLLVLGVVVCPLLLWCVEEWCGKKPCCWWTVLWCLTSCNIRTDSLSLEVYDCTSLPSVGYHFIVPNYSSAFITSAYTLSSPGALPFFSFLIASLTSWMEMGQCSMYWSYSTSLVSESVGGSHRLKCCWKYSPNLSSLAFSSVLVDMSFAFSVRLWFCPLSPHSFRVILWTVFISLRSVAASASVASLSTYCLLSLLADVFTCLSFSICWANTLSCRLGNLESNAFFFHCLLSSIVFCLSWEIDWDSQVFVYPIVSLAYSIIAVLKSSIVKTVSSWRMLKRFLSLMLNFSLMIVSFCIEMSLRWFLAVPIFAFLNFKVILTTSKLWSLPMSEFLITRTSRREPLNLPLIMKWSIWL